MASSASDGKLNTDHIVTVVFSILVKRLEPLINSLKADLKQKMLGHLNKLLSDSKITIEKNYNDSVDMQFFLAEILWKMHLMEYLNVPKEIKTEFRKNKLWDVPTELWSLESFIIYMSNFHLLKSELLDSVINGKYGTEDNITEDDE